MGGAEQTKAADAHAALPPPRDDETTLHDQPPPHDPMLGATIAGQYRVVGRIGSGGMGVVYRAVQKDLDRHVAIKVLHPSESDDEDTSRRFEKEARIVARLDHPSTLRLFDFGLLPDRRPFFVTEYLEGMTLERLAASGPLPWTRVLSLLEQVAASLEEAHGRSVVHRDLKPENIYVVDLQGEDRAKVLDFGIAKLGASTDTMTGLVCGTPAYMSPEQALGQSVDSSSDLYSLGVVAYRCLAGRPPFLGDAPIAVLLQHVQDVPPPLRSLAPEVPEAVAALVMRLLEKHPSRRLPSAAAVRAEIRTLLEGRSRAAEPPPRRPEATWSVRRMAPLIGLVALATGALLAFAAVGRTRSPERTEPPAPSVAPPPLEPNSVGPPEPKKPPTSPEPALGASDRPDEDGEAEPSRRPRKRRPRGDGQAPPGFHDFEL